MQTLKNNKFKIFGFEFKSIDLFLIYIYTILIILFPLSGLLEYTNFYKKLSVEALLSYGLLVYFSLFLFIILVYLVLLIRAFKYVKSLEERKNNFKKFTIANSIIVALLFIYLVIAEILGCISQGGACGLGLIISLMFLFGPVLVVMVILILLMYIPIIITKFSNKK